MVISSFAAIVYKHALLDLVLFWCVYWLYQVCQKKVLLFTIDYTRDHIEMPFFV